MSMSRPEPDDDVLAELGRVTWRAILLEGLVDTMCHLIRPANPREDRRPIGRKVKDAREVLTTWEQSTQRDLADAWLVRAYAALDARNGLLHAAVVQGNDDEDDSLPHAVMLLLEPHLLPGKEPTTLSLGVMPRGASPYVELSMAPDALAAVAQQLQEAAAGWRDVYMGVSEAEKG